MVESDKKVDFLVVGAQKSGTTTLHAYLSQHPKIRVATKKEVHFFDDAANFTDGVDYRHYHKFFDFQENGVIRGETTPSYMYCREAPGRIWKYNPEIKIIAILRNPIDRAYSHWNMESQRGAEKEPFYKALLLEQERLEQQLPGQNFVHSYADRGFYSHQLIRLWDLFSKQNILVLKFDDLFRKPAEHLMNLYRFLGIQNVDPEEQELQSVHAHKIPYAMPMEHVDKEYLIGVYVQEIKRLESLLDWDCSDWLD